MGRNSHMNFELIERIEELKALGHFDGKDTEYGVARQATEEGESTLSPKQHAVWARVQRDIISIPINEDEEFQQALQKDWEDEARNGG